MKKVVISGGTGLIGREISRLLSAKGYAVAVLSRQAPAEQHNIRLFQWDPAKGVIDSGALEDAYAVIHLAGAGVSEQRWTAARKAAIADSRIQSAQLLAKAIQAQKNPPQVFVSASATGYYGARTTSHIFHEGDNPGHDFLASVCVRWENASAALLSLPVRRVILRTGIVMSPEDAFLKKLLPLARLGWNAPLGSGKQWLPWIHIRDIAGMYVFALEEAHVSGIYNATVSGEEQPDYKTFTRTLGQVLHKPAWLPPVPAFALKLALGEMAEIALNGSRASSQKITSAGYKLLFPRLREALEDLVSYSH